MKVSFKDTKVHPLSLQPHTLTYTHTHTHDRLSYLTNTHYYMLSLCDPQVERLKGMPILIGQRRTCAHFQQQTDMQINNSN